MENSPFPNPEIGFPQAEYDRAAVVLMHEPEDELSVGMFCPRAALFERPFDVAEARREHRAYQQLLQQLGLEVYTVRQLLLKGCVDTQGNWIPGEETDRLRILAAEAVTLTAPDIAPDELERYKATLLEGYTPDDVVRVVLQRPEIELRNTSINTGLTAGYCLNPLMNLFYMRDQVITTSKGVVVGRMHSPQREVECRLVTFCLHKLGIEPIAHIHGDDAFLEGGDFMPMRRCDVINCGLRTTPAAIAQLMEDDALDKELLVVVNDAWREQKQMHLDTYFNVIDHNLVTLCRSRYDAQPGDVKFLTADVYLRRGPGDYQLISSGKPFTDLLRSSGYEILPIAEEQRLGNNFLCIEGREIVLVDGQSDEFMRQLKHHGVTAHRMKLDNLIGGYGAAHCMTQVIARKRIG